MGIAPLKLVFETERLSLRWLNNGDGLLEADLTRLLTPEVLAQLPPPLRVVRSPKDWLAARLAECDVLSVQKAHSLIGLVLLARIGMDVHLGYLLEKDNWGKGLASELVKGLIARLSQTDVARVIGGVGKNNPASARVLQKNGFVHLASEPNQDDTKHYVWTPS